jgi:hypothetical protein
MHVLRREDYETVTEIVEAKLREKACMVVQDLTEAT